MRLIENKPLVKWLAQIAFVGVGVAALVEFYRGMREVTNTPETWRGVRRAERKESKKVSAR